MCDIIYGKGGKGLKCKGGGGRLVEGYNLWKRKNELECKEGWGDISKGWGEGDWGRQGRKIAKKEDPHNKERRKALCAFL